MYLHKCRSVTATEMRQIRGVPVEDLTAIGTGVDQRLPGASVAMPRVRLVPLDDSQLHGAAPGTGRGRCYARSHRP